MSVDKNTLLKLLSDYEGGGVSYKEWNVRRLSAIADAPEELRWFANFLQVYETIGLSEEWQLLRIKIMEENGIKRTKKLPPDPIDKEPFEGVLLDDDVSSNRRDKRLVLA